MVLAALLPVTAAAQAGGAAPPAGAQPEAAAPGSEAATSAATDAPKPGDPGYYRTLAGHRFEPSTFVVDPFSTSSVQTRFGYVYAEVRGPYLVRALPPITCCKDVPVGGFAGALDFSVRIADWLAIRADLSSAVYTGLNRQAIIVAGPGVRTTATAQLLSGLQLGDRFRVAGFLGVGSQPELNVLLLSGLLDAITRGDANVKSIFETSNTLVFDVGATGAVALVRSLGAVAEVEYVAPNKVGSVSSFSANGIAGGGQLDWNMRELWPSVPIGLSANYRILSPLNTSTFQSQQDFNLGIGYTGRPGLSARMQVGGRRFHITSNQLLTTALIVDWVVRYDW
jgi:hypothetical protein